jgi:hypothetical protein
MTEAEIDTRTDRDFYVSVRNDSGQHRFLLGPFVTHQEALANVDRGRVLSRNDPQSPWYSYGTASTDRGAVPRSKVIFE